MSINFMNPECQEAPLSHEEFGLCDDQNSTKAYTDLLDRDKWIATVKNGKRKTLVFTAVDKCLIKDHEHKERGRCDCILISDEHLYFVELKDKSKLWLNEAIEQLESTVQFYIASHDISVFKHKKAFACNKRRAHFQEIDNETNTRCAIRRLKRV